MTKLQIYYTNPVTGKNELVIFSNRLYRFLYELRNTEERIKLSNLLYSVQDYQSNASVRLLFNKEGKPAFDYVDMRGEDSGLISYIPFGKEQLLSDDGRWKREGRQTIKIGKFIRKFFNQAALDTYGITDVTLENISKATALYGNTKNIKFEVVSSYEEITATYHYENTYNGFQGDNEEDLYPGGDASSSMSGSCMRHDKCSDWLECYGNEDSIKLIRMVDVPSGKYLSRAILWENLKTHNGDTIKMMDRVYAYREWMIDAMLDWANDNNYHRKYKQSMDTKNEIITPEGEQHDLGLSYTFSQQYKYYPYLDTFTYLESDCLTVNNGYANVNGYRFQLNSYEDGNIHVYNELNGCDDEDDDNEDDDCRIWVIRHEAFYNEDQIVFLRNGVAELETDCTCIYGSWYHNDTLVWVESEGNYCHTNDVNFCSHQGEWFNNDEFTFIEALGEYIHNEYVVECNMCDGTEIQYDSTLCEELNGLYYEQGHEKLTIKQEANV